MTRKHWLLVGLLWLAFGLRLWGLDDFPPGLRYDELQNHLMAGRVLAGERPIYFAESWGHEPLYHYVQALSLHLLGQSDWSLRLPSVYLGMVGAAALWAVARRWFGETVALLAVFLLAVSFWSIFYDRIGSRVGSAAVYATILAYFLWPGRRGRSGSAIAIVAGGLSLAAGVYSYVAGRLGFGLALVFAAYLFIVSRDRWSQAWPRLLGILLLGGVLVAPMFWDLRQNPALEQRLDLLNRPLAELRRGNVQPVWQLTRRAGEMYVAEGERNWLYNVSGRPIFGPVTAVFFLFGAALAVWRWRNPPYALLLLWLVLGTLPAMLAPPAASLTHTIFAQPAALLLLALGLGAAARWGRQYGRVLSSLLVVGVALWYGLSSAYAYFGVWSRAPQVRELYQGGVTAVADAIRAEPPPDAIFIGAPYINYWHPWNVVAFDLAFPEDMSRIRWFNPAGAWVWPDKGESAVYYFPTAPLAEQQFAPSLALFRTQVTAQSLPHDNFSLYRGRLDGEEEMANATAATQFAWPPDLAGLPSPRSPLSFNGQLALWGTVVPADTSFHPGDVVQFRSYWEVREAGDEPVVAFVHLTRDGLDIWGQQDWLDVRLAGLQRGDRFAQVHRVMVQSDAPPGTYRLQLGLYNPETLQRWPILAGAGQTADRVWVGQIEVVGE